MKNVKKLLALVLALMLAVVMTGLIGAGADVTNTQSEANKHVSPSDVIIPQATKAPAAATKPAGNAGGNKAPAAAAPVEAAPELNDVAASVLAAMGLTADPSAMTVTADGVVIALDTPNGTYGGSKLTSYSDDATYALTSTYSAEEVASFDEWRKTADALTSGKFGEFVKFANAELTALLPDMSADEVTNVLSAILASSAEGVVITAENAPAFWTPDTTVLGVETMEGYVFYLMTQGNDVVLGVTEV